MNKFLSQRNFIGRQKQRGAVLFVGLVFLVLMTLLALTMSGTSIMQERMTGGLRNNQMAVMGAESALREAERRLWAASSDTAATPFIVCGVQGKFDCYSFIPSSPIPEVQSFRSQLDWVPNIGVRYSGAALTGLGASNASANLAQMPVYIIEDLGIETPPGAPAMAQNGLNGQENVGPGTIAKHVYRITARSTGGSATVVRLLESTFAAKSN